MPNETLSKEEVLVYVPVSVKDELPPKECNCYFTMLKQEGEPLIMGSHLYNFNGKEGWDEDENYVPPNYWLKPQPLSSFTAPLLKRIEELEGENGGLEKVQVDYYEDKIERLNLLLVERDTEIERLQNLVHEMFKSGTYVCSWHKFKTIHSL